MMDERERRKDGAPAAAAGPSEQLAALIAERTAELAAANERLRQAQRLQKGILDSIPDIAWLKDKESRFLAVNRPFAEACGVEADALVGKTDLDIWPLELAERYRADDREVMRSGQMKRVEEPLVDQHGQQTWIETIKVPIFNDQGKLIGTAGIARDITERKRAEEVLRRSHAELELLVLERTRELHRANEALKADISRRVEAEQNQRRLVAILEATTDFVGISEVQGRVLYVNRAGRRLLGIAEKEDLSSTTIADYHAPWAAARVVNEGLPAAIRDGVWSAETALLTRDGREIPVSQVILVHRDANGAPEFLSTIIRDISERKAMEAQLLQSQKMEGIGRLAGGIAHDFNNQLTGILGYVEFILGSLPADHPSRGHVEQIRLGAQRAAELTGQLLTFARKQLIEPKVVDLNRLILSTDGLLRRLIGEHIELVTLPAPDLGLVTVDPGQFQQILINLAVNARDAMREGGKLTIETRNLELAAAEAARHPEAVPGAYVMLAVRDTGMGMDKATLTHIFEPFYTTKELGKGTGLGLATCYGIVKQAGGHISVRSEPGQGTSFEILLPRAAAAEATPLGPAQPVETRGGTETILLVEDEPQIRSMVTEALQVQGYQVLTSRGGSEAIRLAQEHPGPIHLLLTDVVMPQMSGPQTAERLGAARPGLKVLYMSGYAESAIAHHGILEEKISLLAKPFTLQTLAQRVREELDR